MPTGSSAWPAAGLAVAVPPASEVLKYQSYTVPIVHLGLKSQSQHSRSLWLRTAVPVPPAEPWIEPQSQSGTGTVCVLAPVTGATIPAHGHAFEAVVYFLTNSHQKQASRDAQTMFVCWLHLLFCMFVVLSAAVVPRSLEVVVVGVGVVMVVQPNGNRIEMRLVHIPRPLCII